MDGVLGMDGCICLMLSKRFLVLTFVLLILRNCERDVRLGSVCFVLLLGAIVGYRDGIGQFKMPTAIWNEWEIAFLSVV